MWVFLSEGFCSVVQDQNDSEKVIVRGRFLEDIERIADHLNQKLGETPTADYPYRFTIAKKRWAQYLRDAAMNIDYDNFKEAVLRRSSRGRHDLYTQIWALLADQAPQQDRINRAERTFDEPLHREQPGLFEKE